MGRKLSIKYFQCHLYKSAISERLLVVLKIFLLCALYEKIRKFFLLCGLYKKNTTDVTIDIFCPPNVMVTSVIFFYIRRKVKKFLTTKAIFLRKQIYRDGIGDTLYKVEGQSKNFENLTAGRPKNNK